MWGSNPLKVGCRTVTRKASGIVFWLDSDQVASASASGEVVTAHPTLHARSNCCNIGLFGRTLRLLDVFHVWRDDGPLGHIGYIKGNWSKIK
jgi:hypothetical protein